MARILSFVFYSIAVVGPIILISNVGDFNRAMEMFFGIESFKVVTNLTIFVFFIANIAIGLIINLLAGILDQITYSNILKDFTQRNEKSQLVENEDKKIPDYNAQENKKQENKSNISTIIVIAVLLLPVITTIIAMIQ